MWANPSIGSQTTRENRDNTPVSKISKPIANVSDMNNLKEFQRILKNNYNYIQTT